MPILALPEKNLSAKDLDIRTRSVRAWLDTLPATRPVDAANALFERVHRANRTPVPPDVFAAMLRSYDAGVAEFLDLAHVKPNTLGNVRMLLHL